VDVFLGEDFGPDVKFDIAPCPSDGLIDFRDIAATVDAFLELPYPCTLPCP
jgi:hypothetical protein